MDCCLAVTTTASTVWDPVDWALAVPAASITPIRVITALDALTRQFRFNDIRTPGKSVSEMLSPARFAGRGDLTDP